MGGWVRKFLTTDKLYKTKPVYIYSMTGDMNSRVTKRD